MKGSTKKSRIAKPVESSEDEEIDNQNDGQIGSESDSVDLNDDSKDDDDDNEEEEVEKSDGEEPMKTANLPVKNAIPVKKDILDKIANGFKIDASFFDTQSLTYPEPLEIPNVDDDLKRELEFYKQSLWAAQEAQNRYKKADKPFSRPNDYYAEMLKTDEHMERIRQKLLDESAAIKASDEAKKQRHLKKFGKQVQAAKLAERQKAKRDLQDKVKSFKQKRKTGQLGEDDEFNVDIDDTPSSSKRQKSSSGRGGRGGGSSGRGGKKPMSRSARDSKYGFGGKNRDKRGNNQKSKSSKGKQSKRPGKSKRT